jgi:hypothetical protein
MGSSNFPAASPEAIRGAIHARSNSPVNEMQNLIEDLQKLAAANQKKSFIEETARSGRMRGPFRTYRDPSAALRLGFPKERVIGCFDWRGRRFERVTFAFGAR